MKVTSPEISTADLYFSTIEGTRIQRKSVHDIMQASEKERASYTIWYCSLHTENIVMAAKKRMRAFGPSSLDCFLYAYTRTTNWVEYHRVKQDVLLKLLQIVHDAGADIAFPTRTLHLEGAGAPEGESP